MLQVLLTWKHMQLHCIREYEPQFSSKAGSWKLIQNKDYQMFTKSIITEEGKNILNLVLEHADRKTMITQTIIIY